MKLIRQAIQTKFLPPTNTRGARYKAFCARGSIVVNQKDRLTCDENHIAAAQALVDTFLISDMKGGTLATENPWAKPRVVGCLPDGDYVHVYDVNV